MSTTFRIRPTARFKKLGTYEMFHLAHHLFAADRAASLHKLLSLEARNQRNEWYALKDSNNQLQNYLDDLDLGRRMAEQKTKPDDAITGLLLQVRYAFMFASVRAVAEHFPIDLLGQAVELGVLSSSKGIDLARHTPDIYRIPEALVRVASSLPPSQRELLCKEALEVCRSLQIPVSHRQFEDRPADDPRRDVLICIFPLLPPSQISSAFDILWSMPEFDRTFAIEEVKHFLGTAELDTVAEWVGQNIYNEHAADLASYLAPISQHDGLIKHLPALAHQMMYGDPDTRFIFHYTFYSERLRDILRCLSPEMRREICQSYLDVDLVEYVYREEKAHRRQSHKLPITRRDLKRRLSGQIRDTLRVIGNFIHDLGDGYRTGLLKRLRTEKESVGYAIALANLLPDMNEDEQLVRLRELTGVIRHADDSTEYSSELDETLILVAPTLPRDAVIQIASAVTDRDNLSLNGIEILLNYANSAQEREPNFFYSLAFKMFSKASAKKGWTEEVVKVARQFPQSYHKKVSELFSRTPLQGKLEMIESDIHILLSSAAFSELLRYVTNLDSVPERARLLTRLAKIAPRSRKKLALQMAITAAQEVGDGARLKKGIKRLDRISRRKRIAHLANLYYDKSHDYQFEVFPPDRVEFAKALPESLRGRFISLLFRKAAEKNFQNLKFLVGIFSLLTSAQRKQVALHVLRQISQSKKALHKNAEEFSYLVQQFDPNHRAEYGIQLTKKLKRSRHTLARMEVLSVSLSFLPITTATRIALQIYKRSRKFFTKQTSRRDTTNSSTLLLLARAIPFLPEPMRSAELSRAFASNNDVFYNGESTKALFAGATRSLSPAEKSKIGKRFVRVFREEKPILLDFADSVIPLLDRNTGQRFLQELLSAAQSQSPYDDRGETRQVNFCVTLAEFGMIEEALQLARHIDREDTRASMLARLIPYVSQQRRDAILREALSYLGSVERRSRRNALVDISLSAELLPAEAQQSFVSELLRSLATRSRSEVVGEIIVILPLIRHLGGKHVVSGITEVLSTLGRWWP